VSRIKGRDKREDQQPRHPRGFPEVHPRGTQGDKKLIERIERALFTIDSLGSSKNSRGASLEGGDKRTARLNHTGIKEEECAEIKGKTIGAVGTSMLAVQIRRGIVAKRKNE